MGRFSLLIKSTASMVLVGMLAACGSSSDPVPVTAPAAPAPTSFTVAGTAATGAVFANATITITGSDGTSYPAAGEPAVVTGADGSYTITLPITAKPPFVVKAARDDQSLVSVVAEAKDSTANITPVTNLIASRLCPLGDPAQLAAEIKKDPTLVDATKLAAKVAEVVALIKPVMDAAGVTANPLSGKFVADGTGMDKVLDSLSINITPNSKTTVNIEVAVKQQQAEGAQPAVITFTNTTAPTAALPAVNAADLVPSGTAPLIADLLKRMTACYALPQTDRINAGGKTAADIKATACKDLFVGNDPSKYKSNGAIVSSTGAFSGIFGTGVGATFDRGTYEFTRSNPEKDMVIGYRLTSGSGATSYATFVVRTDTDGKLRQIGNQYKYNGSISSYNQLRNFINQPAADYNSTGYLLDVNNTADVASVDKVIVTSPSGKTFLLKRNPASSYFPLMKVDPTTKVETQTGTSFVRLAREYLDTAKTGDPALADTNNYFSQDRFSAADIIAIPAQAKWKFDYYLAGQTTPDATQYYTTRARAMTIAELKTQPLANMVDTFYADVKAAQTAFAASSTLTSYYVAGNPADSAQAELNWVVPTGALEPTSIQLYGNYLFAPATATTGAVRSNFNDSIGVQSTARKGTIPCSSSGTGDTHCDPTNPTRYATNSRFTGVHLWAQDPAGRQFAHFYAIYTVVVP